MRDASPPIHLVIEGERDKQIVTDLFHAARFDRSGIHLVDARGRSQIAPVAESLAGDGAPCAILVDLDEASVPDAEAHARRQLRLEDPRIRIYCAVPQIEAWLFADDEALPIRDDADPEVRGILRRLPLPEEIPHPRHLARTLFGPPQHWRFLRDIDIGRACARSPSLRSFIEGISDLIGVQRPTIIERVGRTFDRDLLASLISEVSPADAVIWRTLDGTVYTAREVKDAVEEGSDLGRQYASDLLRVSRDFLRRAANREAKQA
ncbi:MAG: DUF4276 family protein [bacterium]|nr:DUF4276 family protein [Myxococcales bacterium]